MAVILYKLNESGDIVSEGFEVDHFHGFVGNGWYLSKKEAMEVSNGLQEENEEKEKEEILNEAKEDSILAEMDNDEIRLAAKKANIKGWHNKRIKTLINELDNI